MAHYVKIGKRNVIWCFIRILCFCFSVSLFLCYVLSSVLYHLLVFFFSLSLSILILSSACGNYFLSIWLCDIVNWHFKRENRLLEMTAFLINLSQFVFSGWNFSSTTIRHTHTHTSTPPRYYSFPIYMFTVHKQFIKCSWIVFMVLCMTPNTILYNVINSYSIYAFNENNLWLQCRSIYIYI